MRSTGNEITRDTWSRALPPVQAKQSMYEAETVNQSCLREIMIFPFAKNKKRKKEKQKKRDKIDTTLSWKPPLNSPGFLIMKQTFLYKHDGTAFAEILQHATASVTQIILHYVLRRFRLSRPFTNT